MSLNLPILETKQYVVSLRDSSKGTSQGRCDGLLIKVGHNVLQLDTYILDLGGIDIILGMDWLGALREVKLD